MVQHMYCVPVYIYTNSSNYINGKFLNVINTTKENKSSYIQFPLSLSLYGFVKHEGRNNKHCS